jgi:signal transduction histidine kinase
MKGSSRGLSLLSGGIVLSVLGYLGNVYSLPMGFGVSFLFGSIFSMLAIWYLGAMPGILTALLIATHTYQLWNHPYAIVIFTAEAAWVYYWLRFGFREKSVQNIVLIDTFYWVFAGAPLVIFFYHQIMGVAWSGTFVILLKQSINGIFNALIASLIIFHLPLEKWPVFSQPAFEKKLNYNQVIFHLVSVFLMLPVLSLFLFHNQQQLKTIQDLAANFARHELQSAERVLGRWLRNNTNATAVLADIGAEYDFKPSPDLQQQLEWFKRANPNFHNVFIGDSNATTIAFFPAQNIKGESTIGLNFNDRPWFQALQQTQRAHISEVFMGRGGIFQPIFSIATPVIREGKLQGFGLGAINLQKMQRILSFHERLDNLELTIYDKHEHIVCSTDATRKPLDHFNIAKDGITEQLDSNTFLWLPAAKANVPAIERYKDAIYYSKMPVRHTSWTLVSEVPADFLQSYVYQQSSGSILMVYLLFFGAIPFSLLVSRRMSRSSAELVEMSRNLSEKLKSRQHLQWPGSSIWEVQNLIVNFKDASQEIQNQYAKIQRNNLELERRVEERTHDLELLTKNLSTQVEQEIGLRRRNEQIAIQKSKLAAMGEMVGAIAHQWRQPLNALSLAIQNLSQKYYDEQLNKEAVEKMSQESMNYVRLMSQMIDDFREFFVPDKERHMFAPQKSIENVLRLFSAQLKQKDIAFSLQQMETVVDNEIKKEQEDREVKIYGYQNEFEHVIMNLLSNAKDAILSIKKSQADYKGRINIAMWNNEKYAYIDFKDNGAGISERDAERIFEPYYSTKKTNKGSGLGLYMSKVMVEDHMQGQIHIHKLKDDTTIRIKLALLEEDDERSKV